MLSFKKLCLEDIPTIRAYFNAYPARQCDRAVGSTTMWRDYFDNHYAIHEGTIILSSNLNSNACFTFPVGRNPELALDELSEYCKSKGMPMVLCTVNKSELPLVMSKYPGSEADANRDWFDYLYDKASLLSLAGRKYSTPRNHINKFKKLYTDWSFEPISEANIAEAIEFTKNFTFHAKKEEESAQLEVKMCLEVLENFDAYAMPGGVLRVGGKIIGYSIGEIIGDTLFCHIEKADTNFAGAYQMLTNQYLRMFAAGDEIRFVNREEDCGDEGLRKSKLSYHPIELIEKNTVKINNERV